jgi:hypothetical protein
MKIEMHGARGQLNSSEIHLNQSEAKHVLQWSDKGKEHCSCVNEEAYKKLNSVVLVRKRTIPTERPQLASKVSANFS